MNPLQAYRLAASVLALDFKQAPAVQLAGNMPQSQRQWEQWVYTLSNQLMLPPVYAALQRHGLLKFLPEDLSLYLSEVYLLNQERNQKILGQLEELREILVDIPFVVMKGTGNMLDGIYNDVGERMVYDIDILVPSDQMVEAAGLLHGQGYHTQKPFNPRAFESTMHYPILLHPGHVAGVEIHRQPVQFLYQKCLPASQVFDTAVPSRKHPGFWVMDMPRRIAHNFIHAQLMHSGHYHARTGLRDLYDLLLLGREVDLEEVFRTWGCYPSASLAWQKLMYRTFGIPEPEPIRRKRGGGGLTRRHEWVMQMGHRKRRLYMIVIMLLQKYIVLPMRVMWNRQARNYVFARLSDRSWYRRHYEGMRRSMGFKSSP
ncbi:MAG: nucleotidyltransferase family protein [Bacteroidales bacterium]